MNKIASFLMPIRIAMVAVLLVFMIYLQMGAKESDAAIGDVAGAVVNTLDTSTMEESANRKFKKFYGLNAGDYEGVVLYAPISNMDAEELLIVKLKNSSQAETVRAAIEKRLETQKSSFEGYGIEQYDLLENHILDIRGNYILYVVHSDANKALQAFRDSL
ncbi:MAG: DUF4358 domain-containing protein [Clostridiales bacterium]|nr:DUF4358 domain-containing protein [Clostridiales bacterium]MDY3745441.1 DUF4358 domain-containing protein [Lachnospiraceae bacterium]